MKERLKKIGCFLIVAVLGLPLLSIVWWLFLYRVPQPTPEETFLLLTGAKELPASLRELEVHLAYRPTLGDGSAVISFTVSEEDGKMLTSGLRFTDSEILVAAQQREWAVLSIEIDEPQIASYEEGPFDRAVMANPQRTQLIWSGGI
ncbi:hypothetical protein [Roseibacillus persicicus]|uniref:hypothetical protein n=1 Tax=Roseibacillus persicicus TaxID=454148 RepID=UPI00280FAF72|nr:hypothetical protein [Roseibacillus persicicus]MDQ8190536.1 hypothetical protein [Roseibacillus persicicus]